MLKDKLYFWRRLLTPENELILNRRRISIFPNKAGAVFALVLISIFITSINYGVNLGYALTFVLIGCGWLEIMLTYRNLAGLVLTTATSSAVFSGELAHFSIVIKNRAKHPRYAIAIGFEKTVMHLFDAPQNTHHNLNLALPTKHRGWMPCPKIRLQTSFPFGLLTAWCYWQPAQQILIYPAPELNPPPLPYFVENGDGMKPGIGNDEFTGVRNYQAGDSLKHLAWRQIARQSGGSNERLISKLFEGKQRMVCRLDFASLPPQLHVEAKLSRLCAWLLMAENESIQYAFKLGHQQFDFDSGLDHQRSCLMALALYRHEP